MTTEIRDESSVAVSPQEAEAIFELWAKRQGETEALRSRITVADIAESMAIPPGEVELMLSIVRNMPPNTKQEARKEKKKRRRSRWLIAAAVLIWFTLLVGALGAAYTIGFENSRSYLRYRQDAFRNDEGAILAGANGRTGRWSNSIGQYLPAGLTAEFQGYVQEGTGHTKSLTEANYEHGFLGLINKLKTTESGYVPLGGTQPEMVEALRTGNLEKFSKVIRFEELKVKHKGKEIIAKIPVALVSNPSLEMAVENDIARRVRLLANQTRRLDR